MGAHPLHLWLCITTGAWSVQWVPTPPPLALQARSTGPWWVGQLTQPAALSPPIRLPGPAACVLN